MALSRISSSFSIWPLALHFKSQIFLKQKVHHAVSYYFKQPLSLPIQRQFKSGSQGDYAKAKSLYKQGVAHLATKQSHSEAKAKENLLTAEKQLSSLEDAKTSKLRAKIYYELGKLAAPKNNDEAMRFFLAAIQNLPNQKIYLPHMDWEMPSTFVQEASSSLLAEVSISLGNSHFLDGNLESAYKRYRKAADQDLNTLAKAEAWVRIGCIHLIEKGTNKAAKDFETALKIDRVAAFTFMTHSLFYFLPHYYFHAEVIKQKAVVEAPLFTNTIIHFENSLATYDSWINHDDSEVRKNFPKLQMILHEINATIKTNDVREPLIAEILLKLWAFYHPREGETIQIPFDQPSREAASYTVDKVFKLDSIPVYGLKSDHPEAPPLLIFRGTAPSLSREGGIKSMIEDLDPSGVAKRLFLSSYKSIEKWLETVTQKGEGKKARFLGYSQGAALVSLALIKFARYVSNSSLYPSIGFNSPGLDYASLKEWHDLVEECKKAGRTAPILHHYLVEGDFISRYGGGLVGKAFEIITPRKYNVLQAHVNVVLLQHGWKMYEIDLPKDNQAPLRRFVTAFMESGYGTSIYQFLIKNIVVRGFLAANAATSHVKFGRLFNYASEISKIISKAIK